MRSRLLLIRPDHLGDVLLLTPALRALRQGWPEAEITVAVDPGSTPALARNGDIDALIPFPFPGIARAPAGGPLTPYVTLLQAARDLRARLRPFDAAIVLRADHWWGAALAAGAGIPRRFGFAHPDTAPFLTDALPLASRRHAARGNLALLDAVAAAAGREPLVAPGGTADPVAHPLVFVPSREEDERVAALLVRLGGDVRAPVVAIHPGAGAPVKLWDEALWAVVADRLVAEGARIVLTGGPGEGEITGEVARRMAGRPALDLAGQTSVGELAALFARCALVLGPDGGGLHLAVSAGTPTVTLYGPSDPAVFGPWGDPARHHVVTAGMRCARCGDLSPGRPRGAACMMAIGPDTVLREAKGLLELGAGP